MNAVLPPELAAIVRGYQSGKRRPVRPEPREVTLARNAVEAAGLGRDPNACGSASLIEALVEHLRPAYPDELADVVLDELLLDPARAIAEHKPAAPRGTTRRGGYARHLSTARTVGAVRLVEAAYHQGAPA